MTRRENKRRPSSIDQAVGANIQRLRIAQGLTLAELAARLGISHQQLHKYEHGSNRTCASMVYGLSCAMDVPLISLFDGVESIGDFEVLAAELVTARNRCKSIVDATSSLARLDAMSKILCVLKDESGADSVTI
jgi:transcriptional regulator with XRE-family HTH domain